MLSSACRTAVMRLLQHLRKRSIRYSLNMLYFCWDIPLLLFLNFAFLNLEEEGGMNDIVKVGTLAACFF